MARLVIPAPRAVVLRLSWPDEARLTLPPPPRVVLVLPAGLVPVVPGVTAGAVTGSATVTGVVGLVTASAVGTVSGVGYVTQASASASGVATGTVTATVTIAGASLLPAAGSVTGEGTVTGTAAAVLAGTVTGEGTVAGTAAAVLAGTVTGEGTISGVASAIATSAGTITGEGTADGVAVLTTIGPVEVVDDFTALTGWADGWRMKMGAEDGLGRNAHSRDAAIATATKTTALSGQDQWAQVTITTLSGFVGVLLRGGTQVSTNVPTHIGFRVSATKWEFRDCNDPSGPTLTVRKSGTGIFKSGDIISAKVTGDTIYGYVNNVLIDSYSGTPVSSRTGGRAGLNIDNRAARVDDFSAGTWTA